MSSSRESDPAVAAPPVDGDISYTVILCAVLLTAMSTIAVALRFYVRGKLLRSIKSEDWCMLVALLFAIGSGAFVSMESRSGLGHPFKTVTEEEFMGYRKWSYFGTLCYNLSLCFTKISILLLYLRVLTHDYIRKVTWGALAIVVIYNAWGLGMYLSMCIPIASFWDHSIEGYCHPHSVWWALTYLHIITDFMIFLIPIPVVVTMMIPMRQKLGLLGVFTVGLFVCLVSVLRTVWLGQLLYSTDPTWDLVTIANWSTAEINVAVVCGCMPTLRPLLAKVFGPLMDRVFPSPHPSLDDTENQPRTIGSMPLNVFKFSRRPKPRSPAVPVHSEASWTDGATLSVADVETTHIERHRKDTDSDAELVVNREDIAIERNKGPRAPPRIYGRG